MKYHKTLGITCYLVVFLTVYISKTVFGQQSSQVHIHNDGKVHIHRSDALHFSHPMATESPFPDTKVRFGSSNHSSTLAG
ncbi:MAG: hypothetical protein E2O88_02070 [Bacteroidetes bacterium]|nr:MAG: hypothetical protein E2O88_02070 [Bacteroidota bacterium]